MKLRYVGKTDSETLTRGEVYEVEKVKFRGTSVYKVRNDDPILGSTLVPLLFFEKANKVVSIRHWEELEGIDSEDEWGNKTYVREVSNHAILISTYNGLGGETHRTIYRSDSINGAKGGVSRVLAELSICGFEVEKMSPKKLTVKQRMELEYMSVVKGYDWLAIGKDGAGYASERKPFLVEGRWEKGNSYIELMEKYEFFVESITKTYSISEILSKGGLI